MTLTTAAVREPARRTLLAKRAQCSGCNGGQKIFADPDTPPTSLANQLDPGTLLLAGGGARNVPISGLRRNLFARISPPTAPPSTAVTTMPMLQRGLGRMRPPDYMRLHSHQTIRGSTPCFSSGDYSRLDSWARRRAPSCSTTRPARECLSPSCASILFALPGVLAQPWPATVTRQKALLTPRDFVLQHVPT